MSDSRQPWHRSPAVIGLILTLAGFGFFTLLYFLVSRWMLGE
jgi:hypothetical protein